MNKDSWKVPVGLFVILAPIVFAGIAGKSFLASIATLGIWTVYFAGLFVQDRVLNEQMEARAITKVK